MKRVLLSWSSGKDSAWTLHMLRKNAGVDVVGFLTTFNEAVNRVAMHAVRRAVVEAQAAAAGVPLFPVFIPSPCPNEIYEQQMAAAMARAKADGVTHVAFGDLFLADVRKYREDRLYGTGIDPLFPLWGNEAQTDALADTMVDAGLRAIVTCVNPRQLDPRFIGRTYDTTLLRDLRAENHARATQGLAPVDLCAENGEFHTCVTAGPMFSAPIETRIGVTLERDGYVFCDVELAATRPAR